MPQSGPGVIEIFEDFIGAEWIVAETAASGSIGSLRIIGDGIAETDSGAVSLDSDGLSGVIQLTTTNEDKHACGLATAVMWDVALMGTLVLEARIRLPAEANRAVSSVSPMWLPMLSAWKMTSFTVTGPPLP